VRGLLKDAFAVLPTEPLDIPLQASIEIGADGREKEQAHPPSMAVIVRPEAPVQVVLTGHYDTVYPADSRFQTVGTRADGALHGPGIADMKGGISVILAALWFCRRHGLDPLAFGDRVAPAVPVGLFFGRIANFINGELWGRPSDVPWAMAFPTGGDVARHPSQLYQAALEKKSGGKPNVTFEDYVAMSGAAKTMSRLLPLPWKCQMRPFFGYPATTRAIILFVVSYCW
jgi:hypothetical protein